MIKLIFFLPLFGFFILSVRSLVRLFLRFSFGRSVFVCLRRKSRRLILFVVCQSAQSVSPALAWLLHEHVYEYCTHWLHYTFCIHIVQYTWDYKCHVHICEVNKTANEFPALALHTQWCDGHLWQRRPTKKKNFHATLIAWLLRLGNTLLRKWNIVVRVHFRCKYYIFFFSFSPYPCFPFFVRWFFFVRRRRYCCCCAAFIYFATPMACEKSIDCSKHTSKYL